MKTVLFCGDKFHYGLAHLEPLLQSRFDIIAVVLPTLRKWQVLMETYSGEKMSSYGFHKQRTKAFMKKYISQSLISRIPRVYLKTLNAEVILKEHKVPYWYVDDVNSKDLIDRLKATEPDLILCAGFPQIFSRELLAIPKNGAVNFHPSLLPKFRGPSPYFWIIASGETESAITAHYMTEKIDGGDIIAQIKFPISGYTYDDLVRKSIEETPHLINQVFCFFTEGKPVPQKQDASKASYFRYDRENDHRLFWNQNSVRQIYNLTRTGRALCFFGNKKIGIKECSISETAPNSVKNVREEQGTVVDTSKDSIVIKARNGYIHIREVVYKGRTMTAKKLMKRLNIQAGKKFD